ncbi:SDR family oxidoreductase [Pricia sp. S334]|uniref:Peroxisomal trans-2-enoyl-CoA reductase n=1 Tax=Pricia mediterranea TaxID=3076079 RepID=A0ABU3L1H9_9FLAO|nr:SDR family oxidoreductase [Pricia sp. S334]MDT7827586.1 SDR family oxidoreductase [Pricia sp. S334]
MNQTKRPHIAIQRRGQPEEVASRAAFLCSEHASFINGSNIRIDGGSMETAFG